jgi:hypothetical protein
MANSNEYMRRYMLARYHQRMADARKLLGGKCIVCGSIENLELDHINWRTKTLQINKMWSVSAERFTAELEKCQLLCREHHIEKSKIDLSEIVRERGSANQYGRYGPR